MRVNNQQKLFETIHDLYAQSHYDEPSIRYRERFIFNQLFKNMDLNGKKIIELACGSGWNSAYVLKKFPTAIVNGSDISRKACQDYKEYVGRDAFVSDLTQRDSFSNTKYDVVLVIGGIHHCVVDLSATMDNIYDLLEDDGVLLMVEPNAEYFLEGIRKLWYKFDNKFFDESTERALSHNEILEICNDRYDVIDVKYLGGPAYFFILQSIALRVPTFLKHFLATPLFFLERLYNNLPGIRPFPLFIARWRKN